MMRRSLNEFLAFTAAAGLALIAGPEVAMAVAGAWLVIMAWEVLFA